MKAYGQLTEAEHDAIRRHVDALIESLSRELGVCVEAVANTMFMRVQKHPLWGRNATEAHKKASFSAWEGKCERCGQPVDKAEAVYHHLSRGVPNQHRPENLVPHHNRCHDDVHGVTQGSLTKGTHYISTA